MGLRWILLNNGVIDPRYQGHYGAARVSVVWLGSDKSHVARLLLWS